MSSEDRERSMTLTSRTIAVSLMGCLLLGGAVQVYADQSRCVTLLVQGMGPISTSKAAEQSWGALEADAQGRFYWSGFIGFMIERGQRFGGVLRSRSEQVTAADVDTLGADPHGEADFYLLASSLAAQQDGLESRTRELAAAVGAVRELSGFASIRLVCYSASGVAARMWMQGALDGEIRDDWRYRQGAVRHLVTVGTPHLGVGGAVGLASRAWSRYGALTPGSAVLGEINDRRDLPADARYTAVVIQGVGNLVFDAGRVYRPYLRLSSPAVDALPPLMRSGHDGVVHALSAQLHLTPAAARYEDATGQRVEVRFCRLSQSVGDRPEDVAIHNHAMRDPRLWELLHTLIRQDHPVESPAAHRGGLALRQSWARDIALHLAERHVQLRHLTGRIRRSEILVLIEGSDGQPWRWKCRCEVETRNPLGHPRLVQYIVRGAFALTFDRFGRPERMSEAAVEVE